MKIVDLVQWVDLGLAPLTLLPINWRGHFRWTSTPLTVGLVAVVAGEVPRNHNPLAEACDENNLVGVLQLQAGDPRTPPTSGRSTKGTAPPHPSATVNPMPSSCKAADSQCRSRRSTQCATHPRRIPSGTASPSLRPAPDTPCWVVGVAGHRHTGVSIEFSDHHSPAPGSGMAA